MDNKFVSVILDNNIDKTLDYSVPKELEDKIEKGMRIEIPVKGYFRKGYIFEIKEKSDVKKTLPIRRILSERVISKDLFSLALWMAKYYCTSLSKIFKCMVPTSIRKDIKQKTQVYLTSLKTKKELADICRDLLSKNPSQARAIEIFLKVKKGIFLTDLIKQAKISKSPIETLISKKILLEKKIAVDQGDLLLEEDFFPTKPKKLTDEQEDCLKKISSCLDENKFSSHLIHGVTGSGKTEIYLQAIQKALDQDKSSIMLVPEIALTSQTIERFKARFKEKIAVIHHRRSHGQRFDAWHDLLSGDARIVIGARSAIFSPMKNLGLIIIDEEHDTSYKQSEETPTYNARNLAVMRANLAGCTVVLGSATPSLESYYNALMNKYILSNLTKRPNEATLPMVHIVDMKREKERMSSFSYFSSELLDGIKKRYELGEQTILFLNRRGYHTSLICQNCQHTFKCPHCDLALTYHKNENILFCHSCSYTTRTPRECPSCSNSDYIKYKGFGTEHIETSLKLIFPKIRTLRIDRDTTSTKHSHETLFKQFRSGKADVLIGTQMIVKGLHFPSVTLVGVLNTDGALNIPDFRSSERVFQLIMQVAGRAGRADLPGEVIIQTHMPDNPTITLAAKQDFLSFYKEEIENRKLFDYPPFSNMIKIVISSKDEALSKKLINDFREKLIKKLPKDFHLHPVVAAGRAKVKDMFRYQFLIRGKKILLLTKILERIKEEFKLPNGSTLFIDIDPISTFF